MCPTFGVQFSFQTTFRLGLPFNNIAEYLAHIV